MKELFKNKKIELVFDFRNLLLMGISFSSPKEMLVTFLGFTCFYTKIN